MLSFPSLFILISALIYPLLVLAQPHNPPAPEPLILTEDQEEYPLGLHLQILEDPTGKLTIDQVASPEFDSQFLPSQVATPNYGFTDSAYWVRLRLDNQSQINEWWLAVGFANMHFVDLYTPLPDGSGFAVKQTGILRPVSTRDVLNHHILFELPLPTQSQRTIYLRFQNGASMTLPLSLWTWAAYNNRSLIEHLGMGIFFGVLIGLLFYNLFLLFSLREANYLYFVVLLACLIMEEAVYDGYWFAYVLPNLIYLNRFYQPLCFALLTVSILLFSDSFLELKVRRPVLHKVNLAILAVWGGLILLIPFARYHTLAYLMAPWALLSLVAVWIAGVISWKGGFRSSRFFLIAWIGLLVSLIWVLLIRLGVVSSTFLSENAYRLGFLWMAVCWSIALADRINLLKAETESANRELESSEHRLSQILDGMPLGVVLYGFDHKPRYLNKRTEEILRNPAKGIRPDLQAGRTLAQAISYFSLKVAGSRQDYPLENNPVYSALKGEPASADDFEIDQGDRRVPLEVWASPIKDNQGNVESAVVAFLDITQRKKLENELAEYRKHLESLVEERTEELRETNQQLIVEAAERNLLEHSLQQRIEWLSAVNQAHQTAIGDTNLISIYTELSAKILQLLDAALVFILRWDQPGEQCEIACCSLLEDKTPNIRTMKSVFQSDAPVRQEIELGKTICWSADQDGSLPESLQECLREHEVRSCLFAPMRIHQSVLGVLGVAASESTPDALFQQSDLVERMAFDLADLIQDANLRDQALALAAANERTRLARDLHDSVTQVLFSANLVAEVLPQIWSRDPEKGLLRLEKLQRLTRGALAEMRTMLLELRPSALVETPLGNLLAQLTEAIASRSGLPFQLFIERIPPLPENVHTAFYRVAQEALNNVVKHAQAKLVTVSLVATPLPPDSSTGERHEVRLVVRDDGVGFSAEKRRSDRLGIGIMRERAAAIQANLSLESQPGYGTQLTMIWFGNTEKPL